MWEKGAHEYFGLRTILSTVWRMKRSIPETLAPPDIFPVITHFLPCLGPRFDVRRAINGHRGIRLDGLWKNVTKKRIFIFAWYKSPGNIDVVPARSSPCHPTCKIDGSAEVSGSLPRFFHFIAIDGRKLFLDRCSCFIDRIGYWLNGRSKKITIAIDEFFIFTCEVWLRRSLISVY